MGLSDLDAFARLVSRSYAFALRARDDQGYPQVSGREDNMTTAYESVAQFNLSIPSQHVACVSEKVGDYPSLRNVATPDPAAIRPGHALVRIAYAGVCHSDVALALGQGTHRPVEPVISGHEGVGYVVALGEHIRPGGPPAFGSRVGIKFIADTCGTCDACLAGAEEMCDTPEVAGITRQGVFQQYAVVSTMHLVPIPDALSLEIAAPVLCAGLTTYKAVLSCGLRPGDWLVVPGAGGGLGHLAVQYALALNMRVIAIDTGREKQDLMESYGVHCWIDFATETDIVAAIAKATSGRMARAAIVTAGSIKPYETAMSYLSTRSTLVCIGFPKGQTMQVDPTQMVLKSMRIIGSSVGNRRELKEALELVAMGKVKVEITQRPLGELADVYRDLEGAKVRGRIVVKMP